MKWYAWRVCLLANSARHGSDRRGSERKEAIGKALELRPDIILMDMVMPEMNGAEATAAIIKEWPEAKIVIVTSFLDDDKVYPALEAGAISYILKTSNAKRLRRPSVKR